MPKKLNFLGGQQNYNPNTGEYEPSLQGPNGESPSSFKKFKKGDEEKNSFNEYNDKRLGKTKEETTSFKVDKEKKPEIDTSTQEGKREHNKWTAENTEPGKVIKYHPLLRSVDNANSFTFGEETDRAKMLNNGLAMRTKKVAIGGYFKDANGKYKVREGYGIIDVETGLVAGRAESYEDALEMSTNNKEYLDKINRARDSFKNKYSNVFSSKPQEQKSEISQKEKDTAKKQMEKARKYMEKFWVDTAEKRHMKSEMDYLLSNYEHDNDKKAALDLAKQNIKKWQRFSYLDTNEMRDPRLAYFNRMVEYMEKNL